MAMDEDWVQWIDEYSGRGDAKGYIDGKIITANAAMDTAKENLTESTSTMNGLIQDLQTTQNTLLSQGAIPDWDVTNATFDASTLTNENAPDDPNLRDIYPDPHTDPLEVDDWTLPSGVGDLPDPLNLDQVDTSSLDNIEYPDTTSLDNLTEPDVTDLAKITDVDKSPLDIEPPDSSQIDNFPDVAMTFSPSDYVGSLVDYLSSEVRGFLSSIDPDDYKVNVESNVALDGNTGAITIVDPNIETSIYDKAISRMATEEAAAIDQANSSIQARGFSLPPGALNAILSDIQAKNAIAQEDLNNDIITTRITLEQKRTEYELTKAGQVTEAQYKHDSIRVEYEKLNADYLRALAEVRAVYIESGVKLETLLVGIHTQEQTLLFETDKEDVASILRVYDSKVETYKSLMEAFKIESELAVARIKVDTDYNQALLDIYLGKMEGSKMDADLAISKVNADGDVSKIQMELATTKITADTDYNKSLLEIFLGELEGAKTSIAVEQAKLEGKKTNAEIGEMIIKSEIEVLVSQNERLATLANVYESDVKAYAAKMDGLETAQTLDLTRYDIESKGKITEIKAAIDKATLSVESAVKVAALQIEAIKGDAAVAASIISSALNSTNMSASFGYDGGAKVSNSKGKTESVGYGYSYSGACEDVSNPTDKQ